ncbi:MAG: hypothetical protein PHF84_06215 [bacterium]|nr:hypothetical protein [bacterium]
MGNLSLRDYIRILFRRKMIILITFISVIFFTVVGLLFKVPEYESQVKLMLSLKESSIKALSPESGVVDTECEVVLTYPILKRALIQLKYHKRPKDYILQYCPKLTRPFFKWHLDVMEAINKLLEDPDAQKPNPEFIYQEGVTALRDILEVKTIKGTDLFSIYALDYDSEESARIANVVSHSYIIFDLKRQLAELTVKLEDQDPNIIQLRSMIYRMERNLDKEDLFNIENLGLSSVKIVEAANPPVKPKGLPKVILLILSAVAGMILGFILAFVFEYLDDTVKGPEDIEDYFNLPLLGFIPKAKIKNYCYNYDMKDIIKPKKVQAAYENLADEIYLTLNKDNFKVVHIASTISNADISRIIAGIGVILSSKNKYNVLIIDTNLRNPSLQIIFGLDPKFNFNNFLGNKDQKPVIQKITENLSLLPVSATAYSPAVIFNSERMQKFIFDAKKEYDIILINSSSMKNNNDSYMISALTDGVIYIINEGQDRRQAIKSKIASLQDKKIKFFGAILNNRTFVIPEMLIKWI